MALEVRTLARVEEPERAKQVQDFLAGVLDGLNRLGLTTHAYVYTHDPERPKFQDPTTVQGWGVSIRFGSYEEAAEFYRSLNGAALDNAELVPPKPRLRRAA